MDKAVTPPRPTVEVEPVDPASANSSLDITIRRGDGKVITQHRAEGSSTVQIVRDAVERVIGDRKTIEALP